MPPHRCYVEVFGGMGSVLLNKRPSKVEVYNDKYGDLVNFFICVKTDPQKLSMELDKLPYSRKVFLKLIDDFKGKDIDDPFCLDYVRASHFFYLLHLGFAAHTPLDLNRGDFGYGTTRNRAVEFRKKIKTLNWAATRLSNVLIECFDFLDCLKRYDTSETLFYCDPPYISTRNAGIPFGENDHLNLCEALKTVKGKWILTYGNHPLIQEWYKPYVIRFVDTSQSANLSHSLRNQNQHLIISNFKTL